MQAAQVSSSFIHKRTSLRSRLGAGVLSLGVLVVLTLAVLTIGVHAPELRERVERLVAMDMPRPAGEKPERQRDDTSKAEQATREPTPPTPETEQAPVREFNYIRLTRQEMVAADIASMPRAGASANSGADEGGGDVAATGPGGEHLYKARWVREPTRAELSTYLPRGGGGHWGMIACRTIEHNHVEDCQELGESPPGSGMARGLRQASWQFLVYPPKRGGKALVGAWVSIRFDYTDGPKER